VKRGAIRHISWNASAVADTLATQPADRPRLTLERATPEVPGTIFAAAVSSPQITPPPTSAVEEAKVLLRVAAEVEGALMVQYLYAAYSILPGVTVTAPPIPTSINSDDWYDLTRDIAKQEMGHLITVQNLLLSLGEMPHLDRENFPWLNSGLYPFPFHLQVLGLETLAKNVTAEAPRSVAASDLADYTEAAARAATVAGQVSRVGQIYERLYFLFQDTDEPQEPWTDLVNPFADWPSWQVADSLVGFNQDRQAQPNEWRGDDSTIPPDTAIYVVPITAKASARKAIFAVALQGEGTPSGEGIETHFEKFLRVYREFRAYFALGGAPAMVRNQATDPRTDAGNTGTVTDPVAKLWAQLANTRYQMALMDIALALSTGNSGSVTGTTALRHDFIGWAIGVEMLMAVKKIGEELRSMPLNQNAPPDSVRAGLPFELPEDTDLPNTIPEQVARLRQLVAQSTAIRASIRQSGNPTPRQQGLLTVLDNADSSISQKIGRDMK
jgi:ferritin-like protein